MQIQLDFSPEQSLRSLCALRGCAVIGLITVILGLHYGMALTLPVRPMLGLGLGLTLWTALTLWRMTRAWPVTQPEIFAQLSVDTAALTLLFAISGGPGNPFVSFYLVPIAIAAVMLSRAWAWAVTLLCMALYGWLIAGFSEHLQHHADPGGFQLHVLGMWLNFLLSAVLMTIFVTTVAEAVRRRDRSLAAAREEALRNEQILMVGTLAAGAAHELSTPLSTMSVIVGELREQHRNNPELATDLQLLKEQIGVCRQQLALLLSAAGQNRAETVPRRRLQAFLLDVLDRCRLMRPDIRLDNEWAAHFVDCEILAEPTLAQAILAALNNAGDAGNSAGDPAVSVLTACDGRLLTIEIADRGSGLDALQQAQAGRAVFTTKPQGYGLGLVLSHATLERLGGELQLEPRQGGGTVARIALPLQAIAGQ